MKNLFLINAEVLGFSEAVIVTVKEEKKPNPVLMKLTDSDEMLVGNLVKDELFDLTVLHTGADWTNPVCVSPDEAVIVGRVVSVASAENLKFKNAEVKNV